MDGFGNGYARHLDSTDCGAKLISSQATTTWSDESSLGGDEAENSADASVAATSRMAAVTDSGICLDCLVKAATAGSAVVIRE